MAQEDESETSQQTVASEDEKLTENQASPTIIEIQDSTTECEEEARPGHLQMEEKVFVSSLHSFMKDRGTPIERIPHLGFKQINLWRIFKAVEKLGGYDSVTVRRLWKKVYDELGGSPGSTSAATCTRRHYEKLVLPFERHVKGEEDKPLPPSKPRKPYKRNLESKIHKVEKKRKRTQSDRELDPEILTQRSPDVACHGEAVMRPHPLWPAASDRHHPEPNRAATSLHNSVYARLVQVPTSNSWTPHIPAAAAASVGEVISPLEKKKRMAQASLHLPQSPQSEDKERPSVIQCSLSPAQASSSQNCNSSEGSPVPLSSSSSRSSSPSSVSSEDGAVVTERRPVSATELQRHCSTSDGETSGCREESRSGSCGQTPKDTAGHSKDLSPISIKPADSLKVQVIDPAWKPNFKGSARYYTLHPSSPFSVKSDWVPTPSSSFTKVIPKSVPVLRPTPTLPSYKTHQAGLLQQDDSVTRAKKLNVAPWFYQTEKREKPRTMLQKVPSAQQSMCHSTANQPALRTLSSYDKSGRDSRHQSPLHPVFLPNRMRLPQSQLLYHHVPVSPAHSALIGPAVYPYPYSIPLLNPQPGYTIPAMNTIYPHKL